MENISLLAENWRVVLSLLPSNWRELDIETGAMHRQLKGFSWAKALLRTLLLYVAKGYSLRETVVKAKAAGIADVSDVTLLKRFRCSEYWLKTLCEIIFNKRARGIPLENNGIIMRVVDGTHVKEPGKRGSD